VSCRSQYSFEDGELPALVSGELQASGRSPQARVLSISKDERLEGTIKARNMPGMAAVRLPDLSAFDVSPGGAHALRKELRRRGIEVQVVAWENALWLRVSSALYNSIADFEALGAAISDLSGSPMRSEQEVGLSREEANGNTPVAADDASSQLQSEFRGGNDAHQLDGSAEESHSTQPASGDGGSNGATKRTFVPAEQTGIKAVAQVVNVHLTSDKGHIGVAFAPSE
jgi:hypothetical protein